MPIAYKNKIYTALGTPTNLSGDVVSATDSAGVPAKDYTVKGKSIVWNQMLQNPNYSNTVVDTRAYVQFMVLQNVSPYKVFLSLELQKPGLVSAIFTVTASGECRIKHNGSEDDIVFYYFTPVKDHKYYIYINFTSTNPTVAGGITFDKAQLFDLTQMFGVDNEPATPAEFRAMFPDDYYPYNAGELKSIMPTNIEASGVERFQLLDKSKYPVTATTNGVTLTNNGDGTITVNGIASSNVNRYLIDLPDKFGIVSHKYFSCGCPSGGSYNTYRIIASIYLNGVWKDGFSDDGTKGGNISPVLSSEEIITISISILSGYTANNLIFKPQLFDLTQMFGAGNEPSTPEEFWQRVPETLYGYNPNDYKSVNIPSSKYFPDGMRSAGSAYDEINFLSQKAIKRVGFVDMGTLNWSYSTSRTAFQTNDLNTEIKFPATSSDAANLICTKYSVESYASGWAGTIDKCCGTTFANATKWFWVRDTAYTDAAAFKAAMSGVMLYYELATPVETTITPPLQALSTFNGFTSFSAPNSLTQNGPLSVTYYAEGGANPEKGWLTSYKRKLYMGRTIEWNQLFVNSVTSSNGVTILNNQDGTMTLNGTANKIYINFTDLSDAMNQVHKYLLCLKILNNPDNVSFRYSWLNRGLEMRTDAILTGESCVVCNQTESLTQSGIRTGVTGFEAGTVFNNVKIAVMVMDLTQMFGAGNEPATPEEFWSYFDHKLYPYNAGETQPLFKISRKSLWAVAPKHYTARWDKVHAAMVRLNDAASFPTNITNFAHRGSVNANYSNPFDNIYPWSGIKLCNISIDLYRNLAAGDSITNCVTAWEGDANFSYNDTNGVWRYRPEFWGKSWEDDTYRYFDVADNKVYDSSYVYYPEAIVGRWHGRAVTLTAGGKNQICLVPSVGMPAKRIAVRNLQIYARRYGATIDSIFSIDADVLLCIVEFATMNTQNAIGNGVTSMYRQSSDLIAENATNSNVVKVLASAASGFCIPGAIFDIGTSNGGVEVGSYYIVSAQPNVVDAQYLDVTLNEAVTVTTANYWSVHGIINVADEEIGSKSGYIGENGKCNSYYRGLVLFGNMWLYTLGAYENKDDHHIWIANSDEEADKYVALNTSVHYDTGLVLPTPGGYIKKLGMLSRSGLLSIPAFCVETGGDSINPTGDSCYNEVYTSNTVLLRGGGTLDGSGVGAFCGYWSSPASTSNWSCAARPRLKNP